MSPNPAAIKLLVLDVDGTLTDGGLYFDSAGGEMKKFHVRDGLAITAAMACGLKVGVISARQSPIVERRMAELGVTLLMQGQRDKKIAFETLCQQAGVLPEEAAYMGDDLLDLPAMVMCGYAIAVADAAAEVRYAAHHTTQLPGGRAAVREAIEHLLRQQGRWDAVVDRYAI